MRGAKYLAEDRGAFEAPGELAAPALVIADAQEEARAPLYEVAAAHDGQPPVEWLRMFRSFWKTAQ